MADKSDIVRVKSAYEYIMNFREGFASGSDRLYMPDKTPLEWARKQAATYGNHPSGGPAEFIRAVRIMEHRVAESLVVQTCQFGQGCTKRADVDCATTFGPWGYMCAEHYERVGRGLGLGAGQVMIYLTHTNEAGYTVLSNQFNQP